MRNLKTLTRREFVKMLGLITGSISIGSAFLPIGCGYPTAEVASNDKYSVKNNMISITLEQVPQLSNVGGALAIVDGDAGIYLIIARTGENDFRVALNQCPHKGKRFGYDHDRCLFICASDKAKFRLDGSIIEGPVEDPLPIFKYQFTKNRLEIDLESLST